jgi:cyclopropane-fatty-acyl-phospholipid synthase
VEFFEGFLDPYLKYTSGLYAEGTSFEQASVAMLDAILAEANLVSGNSVLEVGYGWGALLRRLSERYQGISYTGLSPSLAQHQYGSAHFPSATLHRTSIEAFPIEEGRWNAAFLIGVYCHLEEKKRQLSRIATALRPGGRLVLEDSFFLSQYLYGRHASLPMTRFVQQEIFGYARIVPLSEFVDDLSDCGLRLVRILDVTESYRQTIAHWLEKLPGQAAPYPQLTRAMTRCLKLAQAGWGYTTGNYLITLEKRR